ncbi:MAG: hypothetical protein ACLTSL_07275 [Odoribacter splanchnicus]
MKSEKIIEFIRHPEKINNDDLRELHTLVKRYPYFQTARILYLKALYLLGGVRFRSELKASTVHLTDHKQFFRYLNNQIGFEPLGSGTAIPKISNPIQSNDVPGVTDDYSNSTQEDRSEANHSATPYAPPIQPIDLSGIPGIVDEAPRPENNFSIDVDLDEEIADAQEEKPSVSLDTPEIISGGYRLTDQPHTEEAVITEKESRKSRKKKDDLIERFIQSEPIMPKITSASTDNRDLSKENPYIQEELFSETLAKIYVKQHLYEKAISTYIKLSLKYPEKSVYFADRIEKIKENINNKE